MAEDKSMTLLILAAGMGSRYGGLKQLDPIGPNGEFIIDYSIYDAKRAGFDRVVFIIKEENLELFRDTVGRRIEKVMDVKYVFQKQDNICAGAEVPAERREAVGHGSCGILCKGYGDNEFRSDQC
jgi:dTDP-glucose pyrophosphorylase